MEPIQRFEHQSLTVGAGGDALSRDELDALQSFHGTAGVPYYSLINNGVKFCEYVGVLQVGSTTIEVLPKADKENDKKKWQALLIEMLKSVGIFDVHAPSISALSLKSNSILELYFGLFVKEVEFLLHSGLVKQYRKLEGNTAALNGSLLFAQQISLNLTHRERFYVRRSVYDTNHLLHHILYKTICLISQISSQAELKGRIGSLLLQFPEMPDLRVTEETFSRLRFNRKTETYRRAIDIARLLLLNYHPDVRQGKNHVLALMFDMNALWEKFVYVSIRDGLRKARQPGKVTPQLSKKFWRPNGGSASTAIPDILYSAVGEKSVVLDTKWKNPEKSRPSAADLHQMYVYLHYHKARKVALVYPGINKEAEGRFLDHETEKLNASECGMLFIPVEKNIRTWQNNIYTMFDTWLKRPSPSPTGT